jgi:hypothetical protein
MKIFLPNVTQQRVWHSMGSGMGVRRMELVEGLGMGVCYLVPIL